MTRYDLAKLVQWVGTLDTRKRLQKTAYMLQAAGAPLDTEFRLHHYGPYSHDLATTTDELVSVGLLAETPVEEWQGTRYEYKLTLDGLKAIKHYEAQRSEDKLKALARFKPLAKRLKETDLRVLELAATVRFFCGRDVNLEKAVKLASSFKKEPAASPSMRKAKALAQEILDTPR